MTHPCGFQVRRRGEARWRTICEPDSLIPLIQSEGAVPFFARRDEALIAASAPLLQRREAHREQELVCLRERGDAAWRRPYTFGASFLADGGALVVALVCPHVYPGV